MPFGGYRIMTDPSRRKFLAVAGAGAAAGTVGLTAKGGAASAAVPNAASVKEPVVVLVEDPRSDSLSIMFGDEEVLVRDRDLVIRILNAAGGK